MEDMVSAVQIANPVVVRKIEWLASSTQLGKTAVVDRAVDTLTAEWLQESHGQTPAFLSAQQRLGALLARLDAMPELPHGSNTNPLEWDAYGLPV
jgi:antitoxin VapB